MLIFLCPVTQKQVVFLTILFPKVIFSAIKLTTNTHWLAFIETLLTICSDITKTTKMKNYLSYKANQGRGRDQKTMPANGLMVYLSFVRIG